MSNIHQRYLLFAHSLAKKKFGKTFPNPSVGCVVERDGCVISSGYTSFKGRPHAEYNALNKRKIYALGLDVYKGEPNLNPGYLNIKDVFILPHLGSATKETRTAMGNLAIDNLDEFFKTGNCKNKVN